MIGATPPGAAHIAWAYGALAWPGRPLEHLFRGKNKEVSTFV